MFIELKDTMTHIGTALKSYFVNSLQNTLSKLYFQVSSNQSIKYDSKEVSILNYSSMYFRFWFITLNNRLVRMQRFIGTSFQCLFLYQYFMLNIGHIDIVYI